MITLKISDPFIVKNYFLNENDKGKVFKVEKVEVEKLKRDFINYISQVEVGGYNMNKKFSPGWYYLLWVSFGKYANLVFLYECTGNDYPSKEFFLFSEVMITFKDPSHYIVW